MSPGILAPPTTCSCCLGDQFVIVEQRGVDVEVPCPDCGPCPDPSGHARENDSCETVIRLKAEGRYEPAPDGHCDYCWRRTR